MWGPALTLPSSCTMFCATVRPDQVSFFAPSPARVGSPKGPNRPDCGRLSMHVLPKLSVDVGKGLACPNSVKSGRIRLHFDRSRLQCDRYRFHIGQVRATVGRSLPAFCRTRPNRVGPGPVRSNSSKVGQTRPKWVELGHTLGQHWPFEADPSWHTKPIKQLCMPKAPCPGRTKLLRPGHARVWANAKSGPHLWIDHAPGL